MASAKHARLISTAQWVAAVGMKRVERSVVGAGEQGSLDARARELKAMVGLALARERWSVPLEVDPAPEGAVLVLSLPGSALRNGRGSTIRFPLTGAPLDVQAQQIVETLFEVATAAGASSSMLRSREPPPGNRWCAPE